MIAFIFGTSSVHGYIMDMVNKSGCQNLQQLCSYRVKMLLYKDFYQECTPEMEIFSEVLRGKNVWSPTDFKVMFRFQA